MHDDVVYISLHPKEMMLEMISTRTYACVDVMAPL